MTITKIRAVLLAVLALLVALGLIPASIEELIATHANAVMTGVLAAWAIVAGLRYHQGVDATQLTAVRAGLLAVLAILIGLGLLGQGTAEAIVTQYDKIIPAVLGLWAALAGLRAKAQAELA